MRLISTIIVMGLVTTFTLAVSSTDSIPPYQYDAGVRARLSGDPIFGQCDLRKTGELTSPIITQKLYYSTDGQNSWSSVDAINIGGDRYTAQTGPIAGDAHWRFYFEGEETWGGQTPVYSGSSTCRLPMNYYVMWDDTPGLDSVAYGAGDWLDIRKAGFAISGNRFYGMMIKANDDWRLTDGSYFWFADLHEDNYGYLFSINNPGQPSGSVFYAIAYCREASPPIGPAEFAPGILKVVNEEEVSVVGDAEIITVAETMFVSCLISDLTGEPDFGPFPNDKRYLNVSAQTMHLHAWGTVFSFNTHFYMTDEMKNGHAYYNHPIAEWRSFPSAPNTPPFLSAPYANYNSTLDVTEVGVVYQDADENPPEFVRLNIEARATYELSKAEIVGTYGWIDGVLYTATIPGNHGFGATFTFEAGDGVDEFILPAGALYIEEFALPKLNELVSVSPNPFNSACKIDAPDGARIEIFDIRGAFVDGFQIHSGQGYAIWQPTADVATGVYYVKASLAGETVTKRLVFMK